MKKTAAVLMLLVMLGSLALATTEASSRLNFPAEFEITFWQTVPFAAFWTYAVATQLARGGMVDSNMILAVTAAISAGNAFVHANKVTASPHPVIR